MLLAVDKFNLCIWGVLLTNVLCGWGQVLGEKGRVEANLITLKLLALFPGLSQFYIACSTKAVNEAS